MATLTAEEVTTQPQRLLDDARKGPSDMVLVEGRPLLLTIPLPLDAGLPEALLELAVALYESDQVSLGRAAEVAGLPYSQMIDALGRRGLPVVRYGIEDLDREPALAATRACP